MKKVTAYSPAKDIVSTTWQVPQTHIVLDVDVCAVVDEFAHKREFASRRDVVQHCAAILEQNTQINVIHIKDSSKPHSLCTLEKNSLLLNKTNLFLVHPFWLIFYGFEFYPWILHKSFLIFYNNDISSSNWFAIRNLFQSHKIIFSEFAVSSKQYLYISLYNVVLYALCACNKRNKLPLTCKARKWRGKQTAYALLACHKKTSSP